MRLGLCLLAAVTLSAADLHLTFRSAIDQTDQPYRLIVPSAYDGSRPLPLVFLLHGTGGNQDTMLDDPRYVRFALAATADKHGVFLLSPYGRGTHEYRTFGETDIFEALADATRRYRIDPDRVYFTGHSMGGTGSAYLALRHPDVPAAIAAFAPAYTYPWLLANLLRVPSFWLMGAADEAYYHQGVLPGVERLRQLGANVRFVDLPGKDHYGPLEQFDETLAWLLTFRRNPHPASYRFDVDTPLHGRAWWTTVQSLTDPLEMATIQARAATRHRAEFTLTNVASFLFHPDPVVFDLEKNLEVVVNQRRVFQGELRPGQALAWTPKSARRVPAPPVNLAAWRTHPIATAPAQLDRNGDHSPLALWIAEAMRAATGADIALYNRIYYRGFPIPQGTVDIVDVIQCTRPFDQYLVTADLTGAAIRRILDANQADPAHRVFLAASIDALDPARTYKVAFEGQVADRETILLPTRPTFHQTGIPLSKALYAHAVNQKVIRAPLPRSLR